jgi:5-methylcytosine-specific restriction endonuclease McrA
MSPMVPVPKKTLPKAAEQKLEQYQAAVNAKPDYPARVEAAKALFSTHNRSTNRTFKAVRQALHEMCYGARRCMYCDDAQADEVEHIRPKDLYPEVVFAWENYLYACGPCNGPKNNKFSVISKGRIVDVTRRHNEPVRPPRKGKPALINPRVENPLDFFMLDLANTFEFVVVAPPGSLDHDRAMYTRDVLRLNERDTLKTARRAAFGAYRSLLRDYGDKLAAGDAAEAGRIRGYICDSHHATVWAEMKRQRNAYRELKQLFERAPDSLDWPFPVK